MSAPQPLEERLRAALVQLAEDAMATTDTPRELTRLEQRLTRRARRRRVLAVAAAAVTAVAVATGALLLPGADRDPAPPARPLPVPAQPPVVDVGPRPLPDGAQVATSPLAATDRPQSVVAAGGRLFIWTMDWRTGTTEPVRELDPRTGAVIGQLTAPPPAGFHLWQVAAAAGGGLVVVHASIDLTAEPNRVYVVLDEAGREVDRVETTWGLATSSVATGPDGTWIGTDRQTLTRLTPAGPAERVQLPLRPNVFAVTDEGFWLGDLVSNAVVLVDRSGREVRRYSAPQPDAVTVVGDTLVVSELHGVLVVDLSTGEPIRVLDRSTRSGGRDLVVVDGIAYAAFDDGTLIVVPLDDVDRARSFRTANDDRRDLYAGASVDVAGGLLWIGGAPGRPTTGYDLRALAR